ncbi:MAG: hypothetical protein L0216_17055 [Planctomycetales bacterium]|nr:hypothetical protein [Planctomycetales bacterium]
MRALAFGGPVGLALLLAAPATSAQDKIELVSGDVLDVELLEDFFKPGDEGRQGAPPIGVVCRQGETKLWIPYRCMSPATVYWFTYYSLYPPANHGFFQPRQAPVTPPEEWQAAGEALSGGVSEKAREHFEKAIAEAPAYLATLDQLIAQAPEDQKRFWEDWKAVLGSARQNYAKLLEKEGFRLSEDGSWLTEEEWHRSRGEVKWVDPRDPTGRTFEWVTPAEAEKRNTEAEAEAKRRGTIEDPKLYRRVLLSLARAFPREWVAARDEARRVRVYARLLTGPEEKFTSPIKKEIAERYMRIRVEQDDCGDVYVPKARPDLLTRVRGYKPGDPLVIFGLLYAIPASAGEFRLVILADDVVLR